MGTHSGCGNGKGTSVPAFAAGLSPQDAEAAGFEAPVVHTDDWWRKEASFLQAVKKNTTQSSKAKTVVVIGGGKSAQEYVFLPNLPALLS